MSSNQRIILVLAGILLTVTTFIKDAPVQGKTTKKWTTSETIRLKGYDVSLFAPMMVAKREGNLNSGRLDFC